MNELKTNIQKLINTYEQAYSLLHQQRGAVIDQDVTSLEQLVQKQVDVYETISGAEEQFKQHLHRLHRELRAEGKVSLENVLASLKTPAVELNTLRDELHSLVEKTEHMRQQLVELLHFAQQQNAGIFEAIYSFTTANTDSYDAKGKKMGKSSSGLAINQHA